MFLNISADKQIYYEVKGAGSPVIFIPGWSLDHSVFVEQQEYLSKQNTVILFDPPGTGQSSRFDKYSLDLEAEIIVQLLAELELPLVHLIGWSMGGEAAMSLAVNYPKVARSLTLICTTPCFVEREDWQHGMAKGAFRRFQKGLKREPVETMKYFRQEAMAGSAQGQIEEVLISAGNRTELSCAEQMFQELGVVDLRLECSLIKIPTLIISGDQDAVCRPQAAVFLANAIERAQYEKFNTGHMPFLQQKAKFNELVAKFISK